MCRWSWLASGTPWRGRDKQGTWATDGTAGEGRGEKKHGTQNKVEQRNITYRSRIYQRHLQSNRDLENSFTMLISVGP